MATDSSVATLFQNDRGEQTVLVSWVQAGNDGWGRQFVSSRSYSGKICGSGVSDTADAALTNR